MKDEKQSLAEQFMRIQWLFGRQHIKSHHAHGPAGNPYRGQGRILRLLKMNPAISQKELSYLLDMRPQSLGELLGKLERGGYIVRTPSEADRRVMDVKLTEAGMKAAEEAGEPTRPDAIFDCLTEEERDILYDYLDRIIVAMEEQLGDEGEEAGPGWHRAHGHGDPRGYGYGRGGDPRRRRPE